MQIINAWYFIICHHKKLKSFIFLSFIKGNAIMLMRTLCGFHFKRCFKCFIPFIEEDLTSELRYLNEIQKNARWYIGIFWKFVIKNQQLNKERFFFCSNLHFIRVCVCNACSKFQTKIYNTWVWAYLVNKYSLCSYVTHEEYLIPNTWKNLHSFENL